MSWWEEFWGQLKSLANLLVPRHLRERLVARCVRNTAAGPQEQVHAFISACFVRETLASGSQISGRLIATFQVGEAGLEPFKMVD